MMNSKTKLFLAVIFMAIFSSVVIAQDFLPEPPTPWASRATQKTISIPKPAKPYTNQQLLDSMQFAGDMILRVQHIDGGWRLWNKDPLTDVTAEYLDPPANTIINPEWVGRPFAFDGTHQNQLGVNARALVLISTKVKNPPKDYIGDGTYGASLAMLYNKNLPLYYYFDPVTNQWMRSYYYSTDRVFMGEYTKYVGDATAKAAAIAEWAWTKDNVAYFKTPSALVQRFVEMRANASMIGRYGLGLILWDIGGYADGCEAVDDHAYAVSLLDLMTTEQNFVPPPADPYWNDTANGYSKNIFKNFLKRWDDGTPAKACGDDCAPAAVNDDSKYVEWMFVTAAGQLLQAFQNVDPAKYKTQIDALKSRLANDCQIVDPANPFFGAYSYRKLGWEGLDSQGNGYACMGMAKVGEVVAGQKSTEFLIKTQIPQDEPTTKCHPAFRGGWYDYDSLGNLKIYLEPNCEAVQGMWEISEAEQKPWVKITSNPPGNHQDDVPFAFAIFDLQSNPATVKVEYSLNNGVNWTLIPPLHLSGASTGLSTSPAGVNNSLSWLSYTGSGITDDVNAKLRVTARDDDSPEGWGVPDMTDIFSVKNATIPVELSVFSLE